jgi:hypothetical protein
VLLLPGAAAIRIGAELRKPDVEEDESQPRWIVAPLLDAGLDVDGVRTLLFRVTFECLTGGRSDLSDVSAFLGEQPPPVRAAWVETVNRMLGTGDTAPAT